MSYQFKPGIFEWLSRPEWDSNICQELRPILNYLQSAHGVRIKAFGLWNSKAPDPVAFLDGPLPTSQIKARFDSLPSAVVLEEDFLGCANCRLSVVYEG